VERYNNFSSENKWGGAYAEGGVLNHPFQTHIKYAYATHPLTQHPIDNAKWNATVPSRAL